MVEGTQEPGGEQAGKRTRAAQPIEPPRGGGMSPHIASALVSAIVLVLLAPGVFVAGYFTNAAVDDDGGGGGGAAVVNPTGTAVAAATPTPPVVVDNVSADDDPSWGPTDAKVTVVEFSDFQCPYCERFFTQTYAQIKQQYADKVRFVYRDFPLSSIHPWAEKGAEAAGCAYDQGKFWEFHDALFQNQSTITQTYQTAAQASGEAAALAATIDGFKSTATTLGLDAATFGQCLDSGKYSQEIQKDYQDGISYGVQGTPAFYVNGLAISGAQPLSVFQSAIDSALQEAGG